MITLRTFGDVGSLPYRISVREVGELVGDDYERFTLLTVAEACRRSVPAAVSAWLRLPEQSAEWVEALLHQEGAHQIAWWKRRMALGDEHADVVVDAEKLAKIRRRLEEARRVVRDQHRPTSSEPAESRALDRLRQAHADEYERLYEQLMAVSNLVDFHPPTDETRRLLALSDEEFRGLVASDVQDVMNVPGLAHPGVAGRWSSALAELAERTLDACGFPGPAAGRPHVGPEAFRVQDKWLPVGPLSGTERDAMTARLTFLVHVRVRLTERAHLRRVRNRERSEKVHGPIGERLRRAYFAEYARYRIEEGQKARDEKAEQGAAKEAQEPPP